MPSRPVDELCARLEELIRPCSCRPEYGGLRMRVSQWDAGDGRPHLNIALVYETPEGSTDQINIGHCRERDVFELVDAAHGEIITDSIDEVLEAVRRRVGEIPGCSMHKKGPPAD